MAGGRSTPSRRSGCSNTWANADGRLLRHLHSLLLPGGRLLNHAISSVGGSRLGRRGFSYRYVFPDGELIDVGDTVLAMERAGFEVRDVESLREHYASRCATGSPTSSATGTGGELVGERRARVWLLYMAGSAIGFEDGGVAIHQVLGVVPDPDRRQPHAPDPHELGR